MKFTKKQRQSYLNFGSGTLEKMGYGFDRSFNDDELEYSAERSLWIEVLLRALSDMFNPNYPKVAKETLDWWIEKEESNIVCENAGVSWEYVQELIDKNPDVNTSIAKVRRYNGESRAKRKKTVKGFGSNTRSKHLNNESAYLWDGNPADRLNINAAEKELLHA